MTTNTEKEENFTRKELYDLIWSNPVSKILQGYAVSQTGFKNLCKEHDIPLPLNGYWQKLRHNKKVVVIPLPKTDKTYNNIILPKRLKGEEILNKITELNLLVREIKNDKSLPLVVPDKLIKPDKLIITVKDYFKRVRLSKKNVKVEPPVEGWFSIYVSDELECRALIFADALIKLVTRIRKSVF